MGLSSMIDREKVLAVLLKRFPAASLNDVAAAANASVAMAQATASSS